MKFGFRIFIFIFFIICLFNVSLGSVTEEYNNVLLLLAKQHEKNMSEDYSTTRMVIATNDYYDELDKVLNKVYKELMATLNPDEKIG
ncbi:MAG: lysozyme inhibitor LprI family protein [Cetobacterium sp.]|uniref:lysozyme inhibitor LprI family protein n=1 Tax=Cetobacterium sp. TaxID=2071632 RepID=UPI0025C62198|nr:lysozyme inhibitor LprI family protein [Cetobacterium sp.]